MLSNFNDTEIHLINFFNLDSLCNYECLSKSFNIFINKLELYQWKIDSSENVKSIQISSYDQTIGKVG